MHSSVGWRAKSDDRHAHDERINGSRRAGVRKGVERDVMPPISAEVSALVGVCDGFVGNVTIKSSAGVANVVSKLLTRATSTAEQHPLIRSLSAQLNPQRFNGASLLGLQGSVVKSHGNATAEGFFYAIEQAIREIDHGIPQLIGKRVADIMSSNQGLLTGAKN